MKIKVNGELEYDMLNILQHHITPGRMYIRTGATSEGVLSGTTGTGANRDAQVSFSLMHAINGLLFYRECAAFPPWNFGQLYLI